MCAKRTLTSTTSSRDLFAWRPGRRAAMPGSSSVVPISDDQSAARRRDRGYPPVPIIGSIPCARAPRRSTSGPATAPAPGSAQPWRQPANQCPTPHRVTQLRIHPPAQGFIQRRIGHGDSKTEILRVLRRRRLPPTPTRHPCQRQFSWPRTTRSLAKQQPLDIGDSR